MASPASREELAALLATANEAITAGDAPRARLALDAAEAISPGDEDVATLARQLRDAPPEFPDAGRRGRFTGPRFLGSGLHKDVWYAFDSLFERPVAIAQVRDGISSPGARERAIEEVRAMGRIGSHPNLVTLHEALDEDGRFLLIEDFMAGGTLATLLDRSPGRRLEPVRAVRIAVEVCRALDAVHRHGFVHGDVKPRNIFLDEQGIAHLGDLGSVLRADRSTALIAMGIVGTALYLPPERALGGAIGPRSDLYSLGAVLYEMVTGRPPFRGDDATRVIAQQIKDRPVAPSWLAESCPAALEDAVLRLLAKDPGQRYSSSQAVIDALEASLTATPRPTARLREQPLERVAAGAFVGRAAELATLEEAYRHAEDGAGSVVLVSGDAGMGKSRLVEQLAVFAGVRGARVLSGRSREGPGAPPYWPWIEVGTRFVSEAGVQPIREIGPAAGRLQGMFPVLRELLPDQPPPEEERDPEAARRRLFEAYSSVVKAAADLSPTLVVLEDLHSADDASVALLEHLVGRCRQWNLLIVATFRPPASGERPPRPFQQLKQAEGATLLPLGPLSTADVARYLEDAAGIVPPQHITAEITDRTDGNPFFLAEVVKHLAATGQLLSAQRFEIPESIAAALQLRIAALSPGAATLLQHAAVFGRDFRLRHLAELEAWPEGEVASQLAETLAARVIEATEDDGRLRFTHALMREALLVQLSPNEAGQLNGRAGDVLESQWSGRSEERASRLAEHFFEAATAIPEYRPRAVRYLELAAEQACATYSWSEAARYYRRSLQLVEQLGWQDRVAPLLESHGSCARNAGNVRPAWASLVAAVDLYAASGDVQSAARAALAAMSIPSEDRGALAQRALDLVGDTSPEIEGLLLVHRLRLPGLAGEERHVLQERLDTLAPAYPEADFVAHAQALAAITQLGLGHLQDAATCATQAASRLAAIGERHDAAVALLVAAMALTQAGDLDGARDGYTRVMRQATDSRLHYLGGIGAMALAGLHRMRCEFDRYERMLSLIPGDNWTRQLYAAERAEQAGDADRSAALLPPPSVADGVAEWEIILHGSRARVLYNAFGAEAASEDFERWRRTLFTLTTDTSQSLVEAITSATPLETALGLADECFVALGSDADIERMYDRLKEHGWIRTGGDFRQLDRVRGALALRLGREDEAESHFRQGLAWCGRERCPIEAGRCLQGLAEVAARRGNHETALDFLNQAALSFSGYEAQLFLGQVVAAKLRLQGALGRDPESSIQLADTAGAPNLAASIALAGASDVTIVFTDIDESTPITERLGDSEWVRLLRAHNAIVRETIARFGGREIKTLGDAFMVAFASALDGLRFAVSLQRAMAARNAHADVPLAITVGVHTGTAVSERDDLLGLDVVVASRLCKICEPGTILVTGNVLAAASESSPYRTIPLGPMALKGISAPHPVFAVAWDGP